MAENEDKSCDNKEIPNNPSNEAFKKQSVPLQNNPKTPNQGQKTTNKNTKSGTKSIFNTNRKITEPTQTTTSSAGNKKSNLKNNQKNSPLTPSSTSTGGAGSPGGSGTSSPSSQLGQSNGSPTLGNKIKGCDEVLELYPFNKVFQTEAGHVVELDDNPGGERIHVSHRTGSNIEFHPAGSLSATITRDMWLSVYRDAHVHVDGHANITFDKAVRVVVNKDELENAEDKAVNLDVYVGGKANVNLYVKGGNVNITLDNGDVNMRMKDGDLNIRQDKGNYNHFVNGDYNLEVTGKMHTVVGKDVLTEIGGNRETLVGQDDTLTLTNMFGYANINCFSYQLISSHKREELLGNMTISIGNNYNMSIFGQKNLEVYGIMNTSSYENNIFTKEDYRLTIGGIGNFYTHRWNRSNQRIRRPEDDPCAIALQSGIDNLKLTRSDILSLEKSEPQTCPRREILDLPFIDIFAIKAAEEDPKYLINNEWFNLEKMTFKTVASTLNLSLTRIWEESPSRKRDN